MFSDEFNQSGKSVIFTTGKLQSHLNGILCHHCGQYRTAQIRNPSIIRSLSTTTIPSPSSLLSSSEPQPPHRSTGCWSTTNQSEDKHHVVKDYLSIEQRKLTR